jgi:hypothetical protein
MEVCLGLVGLGVGSMLGSGLGLVFKLGVGSMLVLGFKLGVGSMLVLGQVGLVIQLGLPKGKDYIILAWSSSKKIAYTLHRTEWMEV